jgi:Protein of unknown function (DUF3667)
LSLHQDLANKCPNCGSETSGNYCAQCGQKNHLHDDTVWGLLLHFFEHYFHYDNKFWQTLRALLFNPGKLTIAFRNKQRMRYISPVSLYIFISAMYFLAQHFAANYEEKKIFTQLKNGDHKAKLVVTPGQVTVQSTVVEKKLASAGDRIQQNPEMIKPIIEKVQEATPKIFFFFIPFTALLVQIMFARRKNLFFVDQIIFSLHMHSFYFVVSLVLLPFALIPESMYVSLLTMVIYPVYFVLAMKNTYNISGVRAFFYALIIGIIYSVLYGSTAIAYGIYLWKQMYGI